MQCAAKCNMFSLSLKEKPLPFQAQTAYLDQVNR